MKDVSQLQNIDKIMNDIQAKSEYARVQMDSFIKHLEHILKDISTAADDIKLMVDKQTADLKNELTSRGTLILKNMQKSLKELERCKVICGEFKQLRLKVNWRADPVDVLRAAGELKDRDEEVKKLSIPEIIKPPEIKFISSKINIIYQNENIVGQLTGNH